MEYDDDDEDDADTIYAVKGERYISTENFDELVRLIYIIIIMYDRCIYRIVGNFLGYIEFFADHNLEPRNCVC